MATPGLDAIGRTSMKMTWRYRLSGWREPKTRLEEVTVGRVVVMNHVTLDGVMQGPGRADEDTRGGFRHGGWGAAAGAGLSTTMSARMAAGGGLSGWLFGRWTYEGLLGHWNRQPDSPFTAPLNATPKYVASTELTEPLPWPNSTLLHIPVEKAVPELKQQVDGVLAIMGSGRLIEALLARNVIDEFLLMVHPVVLGSGHRLFPEAFHPWDSGWSTPCQPTPAASPSHTKR